MCSSQGQTEGLINPGELNFFTCELKFGPIEAWIVNWTSLLILRLWSLKFLEICDLCPDGSLELKTCWNGILQTAKRGLKGVFRAAHTHIPFFRECFLPTRKAHIFCFRSLLSVMISEDNTDWLSFENIQVSN